MGNIITSLGIHSAVDYSWQLTHSRGSISVSVSLGPLMNDAAYSVEAVDILSLLFACINVAKSAVYRTIAHNPMVPLPVSPVLVPRTDKQAQQQDSATYWNASKLNIWINMQCFMLIMM